MSTQAGPKIPVILNPYAKSESAGGFKERIAGLGPEVSIHETTSPTAGIDLAFDAAAAGATKVVAAGGDGTIHAVVRGLHKYASGPGEGRMPALGVLPAGTMNVFAHELGVPWNNLPKAWEVVLNGRIEEIDLWEANGRPFMQLAGIGPDAEIIRRTSREAKKKFGPFSYLMEAAGIMGGVSDHPQLNIACADGKTIEGGGVLIGNGRHYGGPIEVFPEAKNNDGLLDLLVFREHRASEMLQLFVGIATSGYKHAAPDLDYLQTKGCTIESKGEPVPFELDGELAGETPVEIKPCSFPLRTIRG